ncbi:MAG: GNAT family N-acetyltransferase [Chloroflexota bacterium]|nr:GNAT family N-acetyltransferase [Chloroflexota bacterium]
MIVSVREAHRDDADVLFGLAEDFVVTFAPSRSAFDPALVDIVSKDDAKLIVAEVDGEIVGYCLGFDHYTFFANGRVSWVEEITVKEAFRGKGVGRILMENFEQWCRKRGSKIVALATRRAAAFYKRLGYDESAVYFRKLL